MNDKQSIDPTCMRLRHYSESDYSKAKFNPISDIPFRNKPGGGLWTSPVDSEHSWVDWCESVNFRACDKYYDVDFYGKLLTIDNERDLDLLPWIEHEGRHFVSFQALCALGFTYDAIHLTAKGERETRFSNPLSLYGWDCETVLILNPNSMRCV